MHTFLVYETKFEVGYVYENLFWLYAKENLKISLSFTPFTFIISEI